jgi:cephalosporin hydroxylase
LSRLAMREVVDRAACVAAFGSWDPAALLKHPDDLARYERVIERTRPEVVVECGTYNGQSAAWFAAQGVDVVSVDVVPPASSPERPKSAAITYIAGDSTHWHAFDQVRDLVGGRRCMVSLDSDHSERHVSREIALYADLVTRGCYLVVEDGIIDWLPSPKPHGCDTYSGSVIAAIDDRLTYDGRFVRDTMIEALTPVTMSPMGWWRRV